MEVMRDRVASQLEEGYEDKIINQDPHIERDVRPGIPQRLRYSSSRILNSASKVDLGNFVQFGGPEGGTQLEWREKKYDIMK